MTEIPLPGPQHPHAYSADEQGFLDAIRCAPTAIPDEEFDRLIELLGRWPTYDLGEDGRLDYDKPITINQLFQDAPLAKQGVDNVLFLGRPFIRRDPEPPCEEDKR